MKGKRKFVIAISVLSVAVVALLGSLVGVLAAFNASAGSGFNVTLTAAPNIEANVACRYHFGGLDNYFSGGTTDLLRTGTVVQTTDKKDVMNFNKADDVQSDVSKSFETIVVTDDAYTELDRLIVVYTFNSSMMNSINVSINDSDLKSKSENIEVTYYLVNTMDGSLYWSDLIDAGEFNGNSFSLSQSIPMTLCVSFASEYSTQDVKIAGNLSFDLSIA